MSVSTTRNLDRERMRRFVQAWDDVLQMVPEARREAVEAAGKAVKQSLDAQIQNADLSSIEAKGRVSSWQRLRLGSGGGWAAISAMKGTVYSWDKRANFGGRTRQHTWYGEPVTARQVTSWLERGHGFGKDLKRSKAMEAKHFKYMYENKMLEPEQSRSGYVSGRQFYASTKDDALKIALKAADKVLCRIADEVDF